MKTRGTKAFTLMELLVVIIAVAVVIALVLPPIHHSIIPTLQHGASYY